MTRTEQIEAIIAARMVAADTTAGEHDAHTALRMREATGDDMPIRWECRAMLNAPYAYAVAYVDTVLRAVTA